MTLKLHVPIRMVYRRVMSYGAVFEIDHLKF
jgi:hypothetical protein